MLGHVVAHGLEQVVALAVVEPAAQARPGAGELVDDGRCALELGGLGEDEVRRHRERDVLDVLEHGRQRAQPTVEEHPRARRGQSFGEELDALLFQVAQRAGVVERLEADHGMAALGLEDGEGVAVRANRQCRREQCARSSKSYFALPCAATAAWAFAISWASPR